MIDPRQREILGGRVESVNDRVQALERAEYSLAFREIQIRESLTD